MNREWSKLEIVMSKIIKSPLKESLESILGISVPVNLDGICSFKELDDNDFLELQDFVCENAKPWWSTGIGILEAAEHIVEEAFANDNINNPRNIEHDLEVGSGYSVTEEFFQLECGTWVWMPNSGSGAYYSHNLKEITDELERLNKNGKL